MTGRSRQVVACWMQAVASTGFTVKIMAVLAKVSTLHELPSVIVDPCLYYCCTRHQALAALRSLCRGLCKNRLINVHGHTHSF